MMTSHEPATGVMSQDWASTEAMGTGLLLNEGQDVFGVNGERDVKFELRCNDRWTLEIDGGEVQS